MPTLDAVCIFSRCLGFNYRTVWQHFLNKCVIIDFLPLLFISWACLIPLVICLGGLYHIRDLWGQERGVVDSVLQLPLGKMMESLNQSLKDVGSFKILLCI